MCLSIFFDSGFIVKHFAPSQMSLAPAGPIAHFGLAPPLESSRKNLLADEQSSGIKGFG